MAIDVVMPQMGESIAEGTIVRWMKRVGDKVDRDEPLFEISTDKVDAEIPSPAAGIVAEIRAKEGETVPVNSIVAVIGPAPAETVVSAAPPPAVTPPPLVAPKPALSVTPAAQTASAPRQPLAQSSDDLVRERSSPLVRKIAKEHHVDISQIHGTGIAGRVTKHDILEFLGQEGQDRQDVRGGPERADAPAVAGGNEDRVEKMSVMRKKIAEHMVLSRRTSAHVHSVFEVNFSRVAQIREARKGEYERAGAKLTYLSFIIKAAADALRAVPVVNASIVGDSVVYHKDVNVGIAVALDWGLIVPVIKHAADRNLLNVSRAVADLAGRARSKQLKPDDVAGGTFTITNPGVFGALFGMPIINQPQVAILGVGAVEKRPMVVDDAIAIRTMAYLSLGYDHRIIDGAVADAFMSHVKHALEHWDSAQA
jgi:pyruvate dehydrogenase E2 component (dihydrolipoamide acetyltransferase)